VENMAEVGRCDKCRAKRIVKHKLCKRCRMRNGTK